jgi:hypothetical protein
VRGGADEDVSGADRWDSIIEFILFLKQGGNEVRKDVKKQETTSEQRVLLAYQTCQWWNAVFIQSRRFLDALEKDHAGMPWDEKETGSMFVADRLFLITAINHAIENIVKLDVELQRMGDDSLCSVVKAIEETTPLDNIKDLRDMNEHWLDYLVNKGKKQKEYISTVEKKDYNVITTPAWTVINGDAELVLLGNVEIDQLLLKMKAQLPIVQKKTREVFEKELFPDANIGVDVSSSLEINNCKSPEKIRRFLKKSKGI